MKKSVGTLLLLTLSLHPTLVHAQRQIAAENSHASLEIQCAPNFDDNTIGIDPDYVIKKVKIATSCYEASHIVEACAAGSLMDSEMTAAAISVCDMFTGRLSKSDSRLRTLMEKRCVRVCNPETEGTLCVSRRSFCNLDVSKFLNSVNSTDQVNAVSTESSSNHASGRRTPYNSEDLF